MEFFSPDVSGKRLPEDFFSVPPDPVLSGAAYFSFEGQDCCPQEDRSLSPDIVPTLLPDYTREFDSSIIKKTFAGRINPVLFLSNFSFLYMLFYVIV